MFRLVLLFAGLALCRGHAILPYAVHAVHTTPIVAPYGHGYGHGFFGHGLWAKPLGHHLLKRSPHFIAPLAHAAPYAHVAPLAPVAHVANVAPVAVSHHSRVDVHSAPAVVASVLPAAHYGAGYYGAGYYGNGHYGAGHYGAGYFGAGHYGAPYSHLGHY